MKNTIQETTQPCYKADKKISQNMFLESCTGGQKANNSWHTVSLTGTCLSMTLETSHSK
jgi:hypothetical protein